MPDKDEMFAWLNDFPRQLEHAAELAGEWDLTSIETPQNVVFLGIGGSAIGADLISSLYHGEFTLPVLVMRGFQKRSWVNHGTLVIAISYSGETDETLRAYRTALDAGAQGLSISSGGALQKMAEEYRKPHLLIPKGLQPRAALGYTSLPLIFALQKTGLIPGNNVNVGSLISLLDTLCLKWRESTGAGADDAKKTVGRLPLIFGGGLTAAIARRFQAQLAENAKTLSIRFEIPEAMHNLVETLDGQNLASLLPLAFELSDPQANPDLRMLFDKIREHLAGERIETIRLFAEGDSPLERMYTLIYKTDWISYHLAILQGVDPVAIPIITALKDQSSPPTV